MSWVALSPAPPFGSAPVDSVEHECSLLGGRDCVHIQQAAKMNFGSRDFRSGGRCVMGVPDLIGHNMVPMVDANVAWDTAVPTSAAGAFLEFDIRWFIESTEADDQDLHLRITERRAVLVTSDEGVHAVTRFRCLMVTGSVSLFRHDALGPGRINPRRQVARRTCMLPVRPNGIPDVDMLLSSAASNGGFCGTNGSGLDQHLTKMLNVRGATQVVAKVWGQASTARASHTSHSKDSCPSIGSDGRPNCNVATNRQDSNSHVF